MGINVENILRVADAIEQHSIPDLGFNMGVFRSKADPTDPSGVDLTGHNCGTVACIAGWAEAVYVREGGDPDRYRSSSWYFGIEDDRTSERLITPPGWRTNPSQFTPERAVAVLRHLAATGEVDWTISSPEAA